MAESRRNRLLRYAVAEEFPATARNAYESARVVSRHKTRIAADEACRRLRRKGQGRYHVWHLSGDGSLSIIIG
jgi:hypothetical protein